MNAKMPTPREVFDETFEALRDAALRCLADRLERELRVYVTMNGSEREKRLFAMHDHQKQVIKNLRRQRTVLLDTLKAIAADGNKFAKAMVEQFEQ